MAEKIPITGEEKESIMTSNIAKVPVKRKILGECGESFFQNRENF